VNTASKPRALRRDLVHALPVIAALAALSLLLPWLHVPAPEGADFARKGINLLLFDRGILRLVPLAVGAALALLLGLSLLGRASRWSVRALVAAFALAVMGGIYTLLTAKVTADASGLMPQPFLIKHLQIGCWAFLLLSLAGLVAALMALRQPATYVVLTAMAVVWLLPILWLLITSLRAEAGAYTPYIIPKGWTLENYTRLFTDTAQFNFPRWYLNTLWVAVITCLVTTTLVLMVAYTLSRLRFPSRRTFLNLGLVIAMFPGFMSMIAVYHILKAVGLAKSLVSLILVYSGSGVLGYRNEPEALEYLLKCSVDHGADMFVKKSDDVTGAIEAEARARGARIVVAGRAANYSGWDLLDELQGRLPGVRFEILGA